MSIEIRPMFHPSVPGLIFQAEGKTLADQIHRIYTFSSKRGFRPLTDFLDNRAEDDDADLPPRTDWYPPAEGLETVRALVQAIESDPKAAQRWSKEDPDGLESLLNDLSSLVECLEQAQAHGVQFRLEIS